MANNGSDVTIKKLTKPAEYKQAKTNSATIFNYKTDTESAWIREAPPKHIDIYGVFENDMLVSQAYSYHFQMMYHGKYIPLQGIGDVCTLIEARNKGYVRQLFNKIFDIERDAGYVFSYLYPFSYEYYGMFGYGFGNSIIKAEIPVAGLTGYKCDYDVKMFKPGDSYEPYLKVFEAFAGQYTGTVKRYERGWLDDYVPVKTHKMMYLFSRNGEPKAFLGFRNYHNQGGNLHVKGDMAWVDTEAFDNILGFIYRLRMHNDKLIMELPESLPIEFMLRELQDTKFERFVTGQARVLNVKKALESYPWCDDENVVYIGVRDDYFAENNGVFSVNFGGGSSKGTGGCCTGKNAMVELCSNDPDIEIDVRVLAPLLLGVHGYDDLKHLRNDFIKINNNEKMLRKVFTRRPVYITERF